MPEQLSVSGAGRMAARQTVRRDQPRNGPVLVEQIWPDVRGRDPQKPGQSEASLFELAVALGRSFREDKQRETLSLARHRSRGRGVGKLGHKTP